MSNARDWHAAAVDKLERQIAATADRWGECVHGPEVAISLRGVSSLTIVGRGERAAQAIVVRTSDDGPVIVSCIYTHENPHTRIDTIINSGEQTLRWQDDRTVPDLQAAVDLVAETAGITPLALTEGH